MEPLTILVGLGYVASAGLPAGLAYVRHRARRALGAGTPDSAADESTPVAPAYRGLVSATPAVRTTLLEVASELNLSPAALATVIELESGWDPGAPRLATGTPRAGLNQVTERAGLPGLDTPERVWAARTWSAERQLRELVRPYFARLAGRSPSWSAFDVYKRNFLPAAVGLPLDAQIAVRDSKEPVVPGVTLTKGAVYAANPGFDHPNANEKKGFFTWADVERVVRDVEGRAKGKWVTIGGQLVDAPTPAAQNARPAPQVSGPPPAPPAQVAPALRALVRQLNERWPGRSRASDGLLGDAAHQARKSDHNEGNALDVTHDPERGPDLDALAERLLADPRVTYVIWNKRIANRQIQGGAWRPYDGTNPHTRHLHVSIRAGARNAERPWALPDAGSAVAGAPAALPLPSVVEGWKEGLVDNVYWTELELGPYRLRVATDALSVRGVRLPVTFREVLELCRTSHYLPPTRAICDARWQAAARRVVLAPLGPPGLPALLERFPTLEAQAREWSKRIGPKSAALLDGPWKEWILEPQLKERQAVNYGLRREGGAVWQRPGHAHDDAHKDWSQLWAPVHRQATRDGEAIDLVDELARGSELLLGGALPPWLVEVLR
ncbi:uncharacterized protein SOCE26_040080 [Sorangium cellulosum]|uniref:ARB-07466-like C-terminal domain-containing protein n=1 Tax=Sorangium cellulosum TaxID=56 RepID=A0A2L0ETG5_SORCE|nr:hypothetical protein [Sorangium cellulosum]AUX42575.1 uncharacterized protein SOCE26_040080 [Sorangium cellulosum]